MLQKHKHPFRLVHYVLLLAFASTTLRFAFMPAPALARAAYAQPHAQPQRPQAGQTADAVSQPTWEPLYQVVTTTLAYTQGNVLVNGVVTPKVMLLDLYQPANAPQGLRPVILAIHGGAFYRESRANKGIVGLAKAFAARGYVVASIEYRMALDNPVPSKRVQGLIDIIQPLDLSQVAASINIPEAQYKATPPSALEDALGALTWLSNQSAALSLDMSRLVVLGGSAGAITTMYTVYASNNFGLTIPKVAAVVDLWGGFGFSQDASALEAGEPPLFMVHGTADTVVPLFFAQAVVKQAEAVGVRHEYYPLEGYQHGFASIDVMSVKVDGLTIFERMERFLDSVLFNHVFLPVANRQ